MNIIIFAGVKVYVPPTQHNEIAGNTKAHGHSCSPQYDHGWSKTDLAIDFIIYTTRERVL